MREPGISQSPDLRLQAILLIDAHIDAVKELALRRCVAGLLVRAAAHSRKEGGDGGAIQMRAEPRSRRRSSSFAGLTWIECRRVGPAREAASVAASAAGLALALVLCAHVAAAFAPLAAAPLHGSRASNQGQIARSFTLDPWPTLGRQKQHIPDGRRAAGAARMLCPVALPVDPALALTLTQLCATRAAQDLERLGVGPGLGGSSPVVYRAGRAVPDPRRSWQGVLRRRLRAARAAVTRPHGAVTLAAGMAAASVAGAVAAVRDEGGGLSPRGTSTLIRSTAAEVVRYPSPYSHTI